jgi:hypothetical protein
VLLCHSLTEQALALLREDPEAEDQGHKRAHRNRRQSRNHSDAARAHNLRRRTNSLHMRIRLTQGSGQMARSVPRAKSQGQDHFPAMLCDAGLLPKPLLL